MELKTQGRGAAAGGGDRLSWRIGLDAIVQELEKIAGADVGGIEGVQPFSGPVVFLKGGASRYIREEAHLRVARAHALAAADDALAVAAEALAANDEALAAIDMM